VLVASLMNLRQLRERLNLSVEDVASRLSKSHSTIRNWESGKTEPTLGVSEMASLCDLYQCTFEELREAVQETKNKS
jgi:putative transcriptional regulator